MNYNTQPKPINTDSIPNELKERDQWITWGYRDGNKIPLQVNGQWAKTNDPSTFSTFDEVSGLDRIAYVIQRDDTYTGVDLDNCLDEHGLLRDWAQPIVMRLMGVGYGEISPSGCGIKFTLRGKKPEGSGCVHRFGDDKQQLEIYDFNRYWAITGGIYVGNDTIAGESVGQPVIDILCREYLRAPAPAVATVDNVTVFASRGNLEGFDPADYPPIDDDDDDYSRPVSHDLRTRAASYLDAIISRGMPTAGSRNNTAFGIAGHLFAIVDDYGDRLPVSEVTEFMLGWNVYLSDPLPDREIRTLCESAARNGTPRETKAPSTNERPQSYSFATMAPADTVRGGAEISGCFIGYVSHPRDIESLRSHAQQYIDYAIKHGIPEGNERCDVAFRLAGVLVRVVDNFSRILPLEETDSLLAQWSDTLDEPFTPEEISEYVRRAAQTGGIKPRLRSQEDRHRLGGVSEIYRETDDDDDEGQSDTSADTSDQILLSLLQAPGTIGMMVDYITQRKIAPEPELAFAPAPLVVIELGFTGREIKHDRIPPLTKSNRETRHGLAKQLRFTFDWLIEPESFAPRPDRRRVSNLSLNLHHMRHRTPPLE